MHPSGQGAFDTIFINLAFYLPFSGSEVWETECQMTWEMPEFWSERNLSWLRFCCMPICPPGCWGLRTMAFELRVFRVARKWPGQNWAETLDRLNSTEPERSGLVLGGWRGSAENHAGMFHPRWMLKQPLLLPPLGQKCWLSSLHPGSKHAAFLWHGLSLRNCVVEYWQWNCASGGIGWMCHHGSFWKKEEMRKICEVNRGAWICVYMCIWWWEIYW